MMDQSMVMATTPASLALTTTLVLTHALTLAVVSCLCMSIIAD